MWRVDDAVDDAGIRGDAGNMDMAHRSEASRIASGVA